ncbi:MAG: hypothetical protein BGO01_18185 [Armatimonadetes bacterium 55-13]|nr:MAG: hypothetical protein BGO01_18185 [Armatimonadetes bacterium 55-13]
MRINPTLETKIDLMNPTSQVPPNPVSTWNEYFQSTRPMPLHPLFGELEPYLPQTGRAADLGCGVGHAVVWLAEKGWDIDAFDGHEEALKSLGERLFAETRSKVATHHCLLQDASLAHGQYDLIIAAYSLFFLTPEQHQVVWNRIYAALKPGGYFLGEFLGVNDDWADQMTTHTAEQVTELLSRYETIYREDVDRDGFVSMGSPKHWHVFHVIARKPV